VIELVIGVILIVGVVYFYVFQRNKPFTPVVPPEEEVLPEGVGA